MLLPTRAALRTGRATLRARHAALRMQCTHSDGWWAGLCSLPLYRCMSRATTQRAGDGCACAAVLQAFIRCCPETACPPSQNVQPGLLYASPAHSFLDLAADVMADNPQLVHSQLSKVRHCFPTRNKRRLPSAAQWQIYKTCKNGRMLAPPVLRTWLSCCRRWCSRRRRPTMPWHAWTSLRAATQRRCVA